jgi:hypothetical protein
VSVSLEPAVADRRAACSPQAKPMKVSGYTFLRNARALGFPAVESIRSVLPICDEFVVNVGRSDDGTLEMIRAIDSEKIRILESEWNDNMRDRGYVYGQQKMIAQFNCSGDWAFYLEGDEVVHEDDLATITISMETAIRTSGRPAGIAAKRGSSRTRSAPAPRTGCSGWCWKRTAKAAIREPPTPAPLSITTAGSAARRR